MRRQGRAVGPLALSFVFVACAGGGVDRPMVSAPATDTAGSPLPVGPAAVQEPLAETLTASRGELDAVAESMVTAMRRLPALDPAAITVLAAPEAASPFAEAMRRALGRAGYRLDRTGSADAARSLQVLADDHTYTVGIGEIFFRRAYARTADGAYAPAGSLYIKGVDPAALSTDAPSSADTPLTALVAAPLVTEAVRSAASRPLMPYTDNVFDLGGSNFGDILQHYDDVEERILVFANDSLRLGDSNKREIAAMAARFDAERDLFSIVGCSLGPTALDNGNQVLATGRANRVKEALLYAGIPAGRILDEGCWAGEALPTMPSRGVILTLKRARP